MNVHEMQERLLQLLAAAHGAGMKVIFPVMVATRLKMTMP